MAYEALIVERVAEAVVLVTLNRPDQLNALNQQTFSELAEAVSEAEADETVRAIVIAGAGGKAFSAGYDVKEMATFTPDQQRSDYSQRDQWMWRIASCRKPVIAAVNGLAYGGGALIALACDIRVGGRKTGFKVTAANYGGANATWSLPSIVGNGLAKEWLMTGRLVGAEEALAHGLLNRLVDDDKVTEAALEIAQAIAANPPAGVQAVKHLIDDNIGRRRADALRAETDYMLANLPAGKIPELFAKFFAKKH